ncbi:hypothetical protein SAMN05421539_11435 [Jannaschia seohaensis]|uniref:Uncharacterized protein n=1 Tax=Jannaschia seohaensis TaxID=475081 RepID=A0A2Y9B514_9RHOB|nr:hypothetical protein BCF38_11435 [Jannaschia seohaensis]SSA50598.1 hypothetical protein SAMN05421539_11435 [Jannaschia seohaensis]
MRGGAAALGTSRRWATVGHMSLRSMAMRDTTRRRLEGKRRGPVSVPGVIVKEERQVPAMPSGRRRRASPARGVRQPRGGGAPRAGPMEEGTGRSRRRPKGGGGGRDPSISCFGPGRSLRGGPPGRLHSAFEGAGASPTAGRDRPGAVGQRNVMPRTAPKILAGSGDAPREEEKERRRPVWSASPGGERPGPIQWEEGSTRCVATQMGGGGRFASRSRV